MFHGEDDGSNSDSSDVTDVPDSPLRAENSSDDEDFDSHSEDEEDMDPYYWKNLAMGGFAGKIKGLKNLVKTLEQQLSHAVTREHAKQSEIDKLRNQVQKLELERVQRVEDEGASVEMEVDEKNDAGQEAKHPLNIFPEEVWQMIFGNLKEAKDVAACAEAAPAFSTALQSTRNQWLFAQVLPLIFDLLSRADILRCRQVCHLWRSGVDQVLDDPLCIPQSSPFLKAPLAKKGFHEWSPFPYHRRTTSGGELASRNFIFGRNVILTLPFSREDFWGQVPSFMEAHGHLIWHLTIQNSFWHRSLREDELCQGISRSLLVHMPNLKSLKFVGTLSSAWNGEGIVTPQHVLESLPALPLLESLEIAQHGYNQLQDIFLSKYGTQLKSFVTPRTSWFREEFQRLDWTHLNSLRLNCARDLSRLQDTFSQIGMPKLTNLHLDELTSPAEIGGVLTFLSRFPALHKLRLGFTKGGNFPCKALWRTCRKINSLPGSLCAPFTLKILEVEAPPNGMEYLWLLKFPSIEELHIQMGSASGWPRGICQHEPVEGVKMQSCLLTGTLYDSNVWKLFPALELLTYLKPSKSAAVYRRRVWKQKNENEM